VVEFLPKHLLEPHNHADYFAVMTSRFQKKKKSATLLLMQIAIAAQLTQSQSHSSIR
jgi:hypothetical protein